MGAEIAVAMAVFKGLQALWGVAKEQGWVSDQDTVTLVTSSIHMLGEGIRITLDATTNPGKYDKLTADEILALLLPSGEDELNARIQARLAADAGV